MIYLELLAVAAVAVYIVDPRLSGFTNSWRAALARILHVRELRPLKPFDCPKCMAWWSCVVYALATHRLTLWTVLACAGLSLLSNPIGELLLFVREGLTQLFASLTRRLP